MQIYTRFSILKISHFVLYTFQISSCLFCANVWVSLLLSSFFVVVNSFFFFFFSVYPLKFIFPYGGIFHSSVFIHYLICLYCFILHTLMTSKFISSTQISISFILIFSRCLIGKHHLNVLKNPQAQNVQ